MRFFPWARRPRGERAEERNPEPVVQTLGVAGSDQEGQAGGNPPVRRDTAAARSARPVLLPLQATSNTDLIALQYFGTVPRGR